MYIDKPTSQKINVDISNTTLGKLVNSLQFFSTILVKGEGASAHKCIKA